jgi:hypothetical protein
MVNVGKIKSLFENKPLAFFLGEESSKCNFTLEEIKEEDKASFKSFIKDSAFFYYVVYNETSSVEDLFLKTMVKTLEEIKERKI